MKKPELLQHLQEIQDEEDSSFDISYNMKEKRITITFKQYDRKAKEAHC